MYKWLLPFLFMVNSAQAFTVDSLFKIDGENSRFFTLKNPEADAVYLAVELSELQRTEKGDYRESVFSADEFLNWPIYIDPMEVVIDGEGEVRVSVVRTEQTTPHDRIIGVSFVPDALRQQEQTGSSVAISIGYKSWYLIPGTQAIAGEPRAWVRDGKITFSNQSNKVLRLTMDVCHEGNKKEESEGCYSEGILLPGNEKAIPLPVNADMKKGRVTFSDLTEKYKKEIALQPAK